MKLSIIIPAYNAASYIDDCLPSVLRQGLNQQDFELILMNDGSTDDTERILLNFKDEFKNFTLINVEHGGVSRARNKALEHVKGQYVYFMDIDDYIADSCLAKLLELCFSYELDILEFANIRTSNRRLHRSNSNIDLPEGLQIFDGKSYLGHRFFSDSLCVYLFRREFIEQSNIRFESGRTKDDMLFNLRIIGKAARIAYYPLDTYRYVVNPNSITTDCSKEGLNRSLNDHIYITGLYAGVMQKYEADGYPMPILYKKQSIQILNITKLILRSGLSLDKLKEIQQYLQQNMLHPYRSKSKQKRLVRFLLGLYNHILLLYLSSKFFRLIRRPLTKWVIVPYRSKRIVPDTV